MLVGVGKYIKAIETTIYHVIGMIVWVSADELKKIVADFEIMTFYIMKVYLLPRF